MSAPLSRFEMERADRAAFEAYHAENPQIFEALRTFALDAKRAGRERLSIAMLFERVRWQTTVEGSGSFKANNSMRAFYSRLLMEQEPELRDFFETRKSKADAA